MSCRRCDEVCSILLCFLMIRRPPRSTQSRSSAASDVYKRQQYLSFAETTNAFRDGSIDAAIVNTAAPAPWVVDLETTHAVKLIALTDEEIGKFTGKFGHFVSADIPKDAYKSLEKDVKTFAVWITLSGRGDLPENDVYEMTKKIFENTDFLKGIHVVGSYITLENVSKISSLPFHPGAVKF